METGRRARTEVLQLVTDTDRRGAQVFASDLEPALERLGWSVRTVALAPGGTGGLGVPVLGPTRRSSKTLRSLRRSARSAAVVVAHGSTTLPVSAVALAGVPVPVVYRQISDSLFWADTVRRRMQVRTALRRMARVVALWEGSARVLADRFGYPVERIRIVPNGVPVERFPALAAAERPGARTGLGLDPELPASLYLGALVQEKGVDLVVRALDALDVQLMVVGEGPQRGELERLADRVAPGRVHFLGSLEDPGRALAAADVVVLASRGGDSMPAALIEAGLSGLPVVATPIGGIVDIVEDGRTGRLVPVGAVEALRRALAEVVGDPELAERLGRRARCHCLEQYSIESVAGRWSAVLDEVVATR